MVNFIELSVTSTRFEHAKEGLLDFGLGLVIGLITGLLLSWVIEPLFKRWADAESKDTQDRSTYFQPAAETPQPVQSAAPEKITKVILRDRDDFERINGIGPVFARRLNEARIFTFEQLASLPVGKIQQLIAVEDWQNADVQGWIDEARQLAAQQQA